MNSVCLNDLLKSSSHYSLALALLELSVCRVRAVSSLIEVNSSQPWWSITIYQCAFEIWRSPSLSSTWLEVTNLRPRGILYCRSHLVLSPDWTAAFFNLNVYMWSLRIFFFLIVDSSTEILGPETTFLTHTQVMLTQLVYGSHLE